MLQMRVLGQFEVSCGGRSIQIPSRPAQSLLAFLALNPGIAHRREKLAGMLWPDSAEPNARANLRAALWRIRKSLEGCAPGVRDCLVVDDIAINFEPPPGFWLDAAVLLQQKPTPDLSLERLIDAASVYRGDLLPGFYDEWVMPERERLRSFVEQVLARLLDSLVEAGRWAETLEWGEKWIALGGAPEPAFQGLMQAHAALGDRSGLLAVYQRAIEALRRELGAEPSAETQALLNRLRAAGQEAAPPSTLPAPSTPFVGREEELRQLALLLADPACGLLTVIGPGGIGKTRLALEVGAAQQPSAAYPDGVYFASLASLGSPSFLASAIAGALGLTLHGLQEPKEQLAAFFRGKRLLLVLDNFEHILDGAPLLAELLASAPGLKLLVTSRERLNLRGEWLFEVGGLTYPADEQNQGIEDYSAVALFLQVARRVQPGLAVSPAEAPWVARICRLVDGLPLAVELAAGWARHLPVAEIAQEIESSLDLLTTESRDMPERHRSIRAVFDHSWNLLADAERAALGRLSVFRGGFEREAAAAVAGASLQTLSALVDKSLLRRATSGRYELHELVRQYAGEALAEAGETEATRRRQLDYFLRWATEAEVKLRSPEHRATSLRLEAEHDNLRAVLDWCLLAGEIEAASHLAAALAEFWWRRGHIREGNEWLGRALAAAPGVAPELRSAALCKAALLAGESGDRPRAIRMAEDALALARQAGDRQGVATSLGLIGGQRHYAGEDAQAVPALEESTRLLRDLGDRWGVAVNLLMLADARMRTGELALGAALWEESLALFQEVGDEWGIGFALGGRGDNARWQGDYPKATELLRQSLALHWERGHRVDVAFSLEAHAILAAAQGRAERAARLWGATEALREAIGAPVPPGYRRDYAPHLAEARAVLGEGAFAAAWAEGRQWTLDQAVAYATAGD